MKKTIISFFALLLIAQFSWAEVEPSTTLTTYYASIDGKATNANDDLRKTLCTVISTGYTSIGYSSLQNSVYAASSDPSDFYIGSSKTMEDIYSSKTYTSSNGKSSATDCGQGWNKEHTVPQSWFNEDSPMKSDAHHVFPTDTRMNSCRSSYPYGENNASKYCNSYGYGHLGTSTFPGYTGQVFDPGSKEEYGENCYRGDLARVYFYMATRYRTTNFTNGSGGTSFTYSGGVADLTDYMKNLMLKWHREDPVSEKELIRNNAIYAHQHNRNPFVDYPELVEYIWGTKAGQIVVLANLVSAYDGDTPPTPVTKYGVTWSANGIETSVDSVAENSKISVLPATPVSCSSESPIFMGWTTAPISGTTDNAPAVLYTKLADFPAVIEDITYYAVFAHAETVEYGPQLGEVTFTFTTTVTTVEDDGVTVTFAQGTNANNAPKYYESGASLRCYGGNTITVTADGITQVVFAFAANDGSNAITPNVGEFATDTWTGNADEVVFTIGGTSGHRKISSMTVTRNGTGGGEIYSRYITSCQDPTEVVEVLVRDASARKILIGGQIYILREGVVYTLTGSRIK